MKKDNQDSIKLIELFDKRSKNILIISIIVILFSFIAPILFVQEKVTIIDFKDTGQIGDTIGGIMNPFIALGGILLTFLAFYIQVLANKQQRDSFRKELDEQNQQFKKTQFENQFYEMLRLHKENVSEISIMLKHVYFNGNQNAQDLRELSGREVFTYMKYEMEILYEVAKQVYENEDKNKWLNRAYEIFFLGIVFDDIKNKSEIDKLFLYKLAEIADADTAGNNKFNEVMNKYNLYFDRLGYNLFRGHSDKLAHYYRHLFQTVKYIANQKNAFINYSEKRNYLRILRAQLSNQEQVLLFYNWKTGFGENWENHINHFFTDYRMIHNLYNEMIINDFNLEDIFLKSSNNYLTEDGRENDFLFEFQN